MPETDADDWIRRLRSSGPEHDAALAELRRVLVRGLSRSLADRGGGEAFAEDIAQDALLKITRSLDTFEGRSRFTTWAITIATRLAISELRRRRFQDVSLHSVTKPGERSLEIAIDGQPGPEQQSEREELLVQLRRLIDEGLTPRQREATHALLDGMPVEEFAYRTGSNRNAVYKLVHDARAKLRVGLEEAGVTADDIAATL
ncbi:RNA polymerase sigma factor [Pirellulimonas nuda]|uniref:RNA polymerase sigma factor n=1 Tax=Pirellulimonas nuda TaxID=2528009 RepID=UPI001E60836D|nr:sigma-70 family RNA polymerase sigma factor [Pirellulimonas nuda]